MLQEEVPRANQRGALSFAMVRLRVKATIVFAESMALRTQEPSIPYQRGHGVT